MNRFRDFTTETLLLTLGVVLVAWEIWRRRLPSYAPWPWSPRRIGGMEWLQGACPHCGQAFIYEIVIGGLNATQAICPVCGLPTPAFGTGKVSPGYLAHLL